MIYTKGYALISRFLLTSLLLGQIFISACGSEQQETPTQPIPTMQLTITNSPTLLPLTSTPTSLPNDWVSRWLRGTPCKPPCYENIIPGKTTRDEAQKIFKANPLISEVEIGQPTPSLGEDGTGYVSWRWKNEFSWGSATYKNISPYVIRTIGTGGRLINFPEIIKLYGEPSHVFAKVYLHYHSPAPSYTPYLVYLSSGFMLSMHEVANVPEIAFDMTFYSLTFFVPGLDGLPDYEYDSSYSLIKFKEILVPWEGFKNFAYYCRDIKNEKFCKDLKTP